MVMPHKFLLFPVMMMPSQPAFLIWVPSLPPTDVSPTVPVRGEREEMVILPEVGDDVPTNGPVKKSNGISGESHE